MAATIGGYTVIGHAETQSVPASNANRRRFISVQAGRALEILGHAIEYLTDEYVHEVKQLSAHDPQVEAIQMLMAIIREMYFECPVMPTFRERLRAWFRFPAH
ncbi:MAG: hypothetical protein WCA10_24210 [Terracidiphilus sp.]